MKNELNNLQLQSMYDNLTTEQFDKLLKIISNKLLILPDDFIENLYESISKSRRLTFKQLACFIKYIEKEDTDYKQF